MQNKPKKHLPRLAVAGNYHRGGADIDGGGRSSHPPVPERHPHFGSQRNSGTDGDTPMAVAVTGAASSAKRRKH